MNNISKEEAIKGAFYGAIVGDALKIYAAYGQKPIEKFMSPGEMMGGSTHGIGWGSWICTMTKETYAQVKQNMPVQHLGGISNAMAIRHVAAYAYYDTEEEIAVVARKTV